MKNDTGKLRQELMNQISLRDFESKGFLSSSQANIQVAELMRSLLNTKWVSASKYIQPFAIRVLEAKAVGCNSRFQIGGLDSY